MSSTLPFRAVALPIAWRRGPIAPQLHARLSATLYFLAIGIAVFAEFIAPGRLGITATLLPVALSIAVTLLLYRIFRAVSPAVALIAVLVNLAGLLLEVIRWQPLGLNLAMVLHGIYAVLLGWLMARSLLLPRFLGACMALAGMIWLLYLVPAAVQRLAPLNTAAGLICEVVPMLWFLIIGVRAARPFAAAQAEEARS